MTNVHLGLYCFALMRCLSPRSAEWFITHRTEPGCARLSFDAGTLAPCDLPEQGVTARSYGVLSVYGGAHRFQAEMMEGIWWSRCKGCS